MPFLRLIRYLWVKPAQIEIDEFNALWGLISAYFHQDMDMEFDGVPEAIAGYARVTAPARTAELLKDMDEFLARYPNDLEGEFHRRYWFDFEPKTIGQTVPEFFDMVRAIVADPECYRTFE